MAYDVVVKGGLIVDAVDEGDEIEVDWTTGDVKNLTKGTSIQGNPIPKQLQEIVVGGGVEAVLRAQGFLAEKMPEGAAVPSGRS